jgi:hypothetical protein
MWKIRKTEPAFGETSENAADESGPSLEAFNKLILKQIQSFLGRNNMLHCEYDDLDFEEIIAEIDPILWKS